MEEIYFISVDVGSGSVRAALADQKGHVLETSVKVLQTWKPKVDFYEQSSNDVWDCCVYVIQVRSNYSENQNFISTVFTTFMFFFVLACCTEY